MTAAPQAEDLEHRADRHIKLGRFKDYAARTDADRVAVAQAEVVERDGTKAGARQKWESMPCRQPNSSAKA